MSNDELTALAEAVSVLHDPDAPPTLADIAWMAITALSTYACLVLAGLTQGGAA